MFSHTTHLLEHAQATYFFKYKQINSHLPEFQT